MDEGANGVGRTNALLAIVLGGLVIVVAVLGFLMFNDHSSDHRHDRAFDHGTVMPYH